MEDVFENAIRKVNELRQAVNTSIQKAFDDNYLIVKDIQVNKQLYDKGEDSKGSIIVPSYTPLTISIKKSKGQPTDRVTLKDTGAFHQNISIIARNDELEITATIKYAQKLFDKYGDDILGIQEEFIKEFMDKYILEEIKEQFNGIVSKP